MFKLSCATNSLTTLSALMLLLCARVVTASTGVDMQSFPFLAPSAKALKEGIVGDATHFGSVKFHSIVIDQGDDKVNLLAVVTHPYAIEATQVYIYAWINGYQKYKLLSLNYYSDTFATRFEIRTIDGAKCLYITDSQSNNVLSTLRIRAHKKYY